MYPVLPHLSIPFRIADGHFAVNEQDTAEDVFECAEAIVRYPLLYRIEKPDFGIPDFTLRRGGVDVSVIRSAIATWEPRAEFNITGAIDESDELVNHVIARVGIRTGAT